jgi:hypothetical protein
MASQGRNAAIVSGKYACPAPGTVVDDGSGEKACCCPYDELGKDPIPILATMLTKEDSLAYDNERECVSHAAQGAGGGGEGDSALVCLCYGTRNNAIPTEGSGGSGDKCDRCEPEGSGGILCKAESGGKQAGSRGFRPIAFYNSDVQPEPIKFPFCQSIFGPKTL